MFWSAIRLFKYGSLLHISSRAEVTNTHALQLPEHFNTCCCNFAKHALVIVISSLQSNFKLIWIWCWFMKISLLVVALCRFTVNSFNQRFLFLSLYVLFSGFHSNLDSSPLLACMLEVGSFDAKATTTKFRYSHPLKYQIRNVAVTWLTIQYVDYMKCR